MVTGPGLQTTYENWKYKIGETYSVVDLSATHVFGVLLNKSRHILVSSIFSPAKIYTSQSDKPI